MSRQCWNGKWDKKVIIFYLCGENQCLALFYDFNYRILRNKIIYGDKLRPDLARSRTQSWPGLGPNFSNLARSDRVPNFRVSIAVSDPVPGQSWYWRKRHRFRKISGISDYVLTMFYLWHKFPVFENAKIFQKTKIKLPG